MTGRPCFALRGMCVGYKATQFIQNDCLTVQYEKDTRDKHGPKEIAEVHAWQNPHRQDRVNNLARRGYTIFQGFRNAAEPKVPGLYKNGAGLAP